MTLNIDLCVVTQKGYCSPENLHMWQSRVEIEHYSVAYFRRITAFEAL